MTTDKPTKMLLAAIAIALWLIALNPWLRPISVAAKGDVDLSNIESYLSSIDSHVGRISRGTCTNSTICR